MHTRLHRPSGAPLQQRAEHPDNRQQQQDNGTHEFQPVQQGDSDAHGDSAHTLQAYLQRARQRGDLPVARPPGAAAAPRPDLHLAK